MCGIVCHFNAERNIDNRELISMYLLQRNRGLDGFGFSYLTEAGIIKTRRFVSEAMCFYELGKVKSKLVLLHHRHPTSTSNVAFQNHPICLETEQGKYAMTHNGIIMNDTELKEDHYKGVTFATEDTTGKFNDSEILLHELVNHIETGAALRCQGSIAFILLVCDKEGKLQRICYGRNYQNPLHHFTHPQEDKTLLHTISSEYQSAKFDQKVDIDLLWSVAWPTLEMTNIKLEIPTKTYNYNRGWNNNKNDDEYVGFHNKKSHGRVLAKSVKKTDSDDRRTHQELYAKALQEAEELYTFLQSIEDFETDIHDRLKIYDFMRETVKQINELETYSLAAYGHCTRRAKTMQQFLRDERKRLLPHCPPSSPAKRMADEQIAKEEIEKGEDALDEFVTLSDAEMDMMAEWERKGYMPNHDQTGWVPVTGKQTIVESAVRKALTSHRSDPLRSIIEIPPAPPLPIIHIGPNNDALQQIMMQQEMREKMSGALGD